MKNFRNENLDGRDFSFQNLQGADFRGSSLRHANFRGADLRRANLRGSYLGFSNFEGADLRGANLDQANFGIMNLHSLVVLDYVKRVRGIKLDKAGLQLLFGEKLNKKRIVRDLLTYYKRYFESAKVRSSILDVIMLLQNHDHDWPELEAIAKSVSKENSNE